MAKSNNINNNALMEQVLNGAKMMFPELNVRVSDISHPTEAFLTRVFIHCLRAFGFRVEPPYNIESESTDTSKEKRVFLSKLCRQVQHILQISFPGKTYTYYDIIEPTAKKTLNTLDVLINYWCFYKMHKKEIIPPIMEKHMERQSLIAEITAKRRELEQRKQQQIQDKIDIAKCEANIRKLREELPKAEAELNQQSKESRQLQSDLATEEEKESEIRSQVKHLKQLVVLDSDVNIVQMETKQLTAHIESYKSEVAKQEQIYKDRRLEIENISQLNDEIENAFNILPPDVVSDYKETLKLKDRLEKRHVTLINKHQSLQDTQVKNQNVLTQQEEKLKTLKLQCEQQDVKDQEKVAEQKALNEKLTAKVEQLEQSKKTLQNQLDEAKQTFKHLNIYVTKLSGEDANLS
ncbi:spindle assembly abnormal protein 6 homolog [Drosophila innubila]|uniref:spindle assembly abnormal protein 6 homolog n=1 Tax=Drosophila innubila TaxID=198719 RepID=UPI00148CE9F1|nr:spindle assembly abnormal protein 6 homolog [Drosophila innubila]